MCINAHPTAGALNTSFHQIRHAELVADLGALGLDVRGLMAVAPLGQPAQPAFGVVRELADRLGLPERSMGMTDDLEAAVAEGSTMVRVGRALFGARPARHAE